jgi:probable HAF family extracellular repeat protein
MHNLFAVAVAALLSAASHAAVLRDALPLPPHTTSIATNINNRGDIIGQYFGAGMSQAFLLSRGRTLSFIDVPGSEDTSVQGLNSKGDIVGTYWTGTEPRHGFVRSHEGHFTTIDVPGGRSTVLTGINDQALAVGYYEEVAALANHDERFRGLIVGSDGLHIVDNPFAIHTFLTGITNSGTIVGYFGNHPAETDHAFLLRKGEWTVVRYPGAQSTQLYGIASNGAMVGAATFAEEPPRAFIYRNGRFDDLGPDLVAFGINASGTIVGWDSNAQAFVMSKSKP